MARRDLLLKSIRQEKIERYPIWLMRQAGRYMQAYRELREREKDFLSFCKNVDLAIKVSLLPLEILDVDAIIIFSDILVPLEAIGIKVRFLEEKGPVLEWDSKPESLKKFDAKETEFVYEIIKGVKREQDEVPVIGFAGAPYTLTAYAIEGHGSKNFRKAKTYMWEREEDFKKTMEIITETLKVYIENQIKAGADVIQIFDSWLDSLPVVEFESMVKPYLIELFSYLKGNYDTPLIYFFRGSSSFLEKLKGMPCDVLSVDWSIDMVEIMRRTEITLQGNLDPSLLYAKTEVIEKKVRDFLNGLPRKTGYIFNLGHGLAPDMSQEKVKFLVDTVKSFKL